MMNADFDEGTLVITRLLDAPPARVFDAWLVREEWQAWIGPEGMSCEVPLLEPRVGGSYRLTMKLSSGETIPVAGIFKVIDRPNTLVFTWGRDGDPSRNSLVTLTFAKKGDQTELTLRQEGLGTAENRDAHDKGWNSTLNKLHRYLAAGATSKGTP